MPKKYLMLLLLCSLFFGFVACSDDNGNTPSTDPDAELYMNDSASVTLIPLVLGNSWKYDKTKGQDEKPDKFIKNLLLDDEIIDQKILPVRMYDKGDGTGKYQYKSLCYITENEYAYFYMYDRIYVGKYSPADSYGYESVTWEYELPQFSTIDSERYFVLDRSVSFSESTKDEYFLHELPGYHDVPVEIGVGLTKTYTNCKKFVYNNVRTSLSDIIKINVFYFKQGIGMIKYQQYVKMPTSPDSALAYEQGLIEK